MRLRRIAALVAGAALAGGTVAALSTSAGAGAQAVPETHIHVNIQKVVDGLPDADQSWTVSGTCTAGALTDDDSDTVSWDEGTGDFSPSSGEFDLNFVLRGVDVDQVSCTITESDEDEAHDFQFQCIDHSASADCTEVSGHSALDITANANANSTVDAQVTNFYGAAPTTTTAATTTTKPGATTTKPGATTTAKAAPRVAGGARFTG